MNTLIPSVKALAVLRNAHMLIGHELRASDGIIGKVDDLYFDDQHWCLRYFVVETGGWLKKRRRVLISPEAIHSPEWNSRTLPIDLTKDQICESPSLEGDPPVSRQSEKLLREHYGWPLYWGAAFSGGSSLPTPSAARVETTSATVKTVASTSALEDSNLRSAKEVSRYRIHASDGEIGHAIDFLIDDRAWDIRYIVLDTKNWLPGKKVVVSPWWISEVNWTDSEITMDLTKESIKQSPDYDPDHALTADYLGKLHDYYGRPYPHRDQSTVMSIESPAFESGCAIPRRYTRYGENRQPPLLFERVPAEAASLALMVDDPDALKGTFTHWIAYNIDPQLSGLVENSDLAGAQEGLNDSGRIGYTGPFPPSGEHRYFLRLYALDCRLDLSGDVPRETFLEALEGHIIAEAEYMGRFATPVPASRRK